MSGGLRARRGSVVGAGCRVLGRPRRGRRVLLTLLCTWRLSLLQRRDRVPEISNTSLQARAPREQVVDLGRCVLLGLGVGVDRSLDLRFESIEEGLDAWVHRLQQFTTVPQSPHLDDGRQIESERRGLVSDTRS